MKRLLTLILTLIITCQILGGSTATMKAASKGENAKKAFTLTSTAFQHEGSILKDYTCDGSDASPALNWSGAPVGTKSFALICDDPDAPGGTWVHWVLFNIPGSDSALKEKVPVTPLLADSSVNGLNSWGKHGYGGPCPPSGTHRYYFKLYALDTYLKLGIKADKTKLLAAMKDHILGQAELMGKYSRG